MPSPRRLVLVLLWSTVARTLGNEAVLLFPKSGVLQFTLGISVPIVMGKKGGLVSTSGFQFNYNLPSNATELEPMLLHARNKRQVEQQQQQQQQQQSPLELKNIYASLEELLERQGWNDGQQCLLRTICELSETPLGRSNEDVVEEMLHLLLTPSEDNPREEEEEEDVYRRAELVGKEERNCRKAYRGCLESPLESFTEIYDDRDRRKASARTEMKELDATLQLYSRSDY